MDKSSQKSFGSKTFWTQNFSGRNLMGSNSFFDQAFCDLKIIFGTNFLTYIFFWWHFFTQIFSWKYFLEFFFSGTQFLDPTFFLVKNLHGPKIVKQKKITENVFCIQNSLDRSFLDLKGFCIKALFNLFLSKEF